jgi:hypothetical protein
LVNDRLGTLAVVLGRTRMPIHMLLRMGRGAVIELDSTDSDMVPPTDRPTLTTNRCPDNPILW